MATGIMAPPGCMQIESVEVIAVIVEEELTQLPSKCPLSLQQCGGAATQGDVLEVSAGTGRNLPYYKYDQLDSLTLTDSSKYMLWHANKKFQEKYASKAAALPVSFLLSDAQQLTAPAAAAVPSNTDAVARRRPAQGLLLPHWYHCPHWSTETCFRPGMASRTSLQSYTLQAASLQLSCLC